MMLSDHSIKESVAKGHIVIEPFDVSCVRPCSVDLHLSKDFRVFKHVDHACIDPKLGAVADYTEKEVIQEGKAFILHPNEFALGSTVEVIGIPNDLVARLEGRSSLGRIGVIIHATAGFVDAGFKGHLTLELSNVGRIPVALYPGMRIAQISFQMLSTPVDVPYGAPELGSKYQGQSGPTESMLKQDFK